MTESGIRLSALLRAAGIETAIDARRDPLIRGVELDSRRVKAGDLFCALRGRQVDGVRFVPEAVARGARAVVAEVDGPAEVGDDVVWIRVGEARRAAGLLARECFARPDESLKIVGITGTNGKTTVAHLVESIAAAGGRRVGRIGTVGYAIAGVESPAQRTTPEAPELYRLLDEMRDAGVEIVAMEVSSHGLALHRVAGARFAVGAFLNLGRDHLDFHESPEAYFAAKARLLESLDETSTAVLPADGEHGARLRRRTRARLLSFGRSRDADVRLSDEHCRLDGSSAVLDTPGGAVPVRTFLPGRFNLDNVAAAAACAWALGLRAESIAAGVVSLQVVPGRVERVDRGQPFTILVDYAHTEEALRNLLGWLKPLASGRLLLVFGCGGERDRGKRAGMGRAAAESGARLFLTSDNPRGEDPEQILRDVAVGVASVPGAGERSVTLVDRRRAIAAAINGATAGDVVVIAGKGHETTQEIGGCNLPFDDRAVAADVLARLGYEERRGA